MEKDINHNDKLDNKRTKKIKELIKFIINLNRKKSEENQYEPIEIKLARRLDQRSYKKLTEEMTFYLIIRYEIDNNKLPSKEELIRILTNFLGNIQKTPDYYKLTENKNEMVLRSKELIGEGSQGAIYSYNLRRYKQTKKESKQLALKIQNFNDAYPIDIHITSAILLVLYGFQPKYYSKNFMEIGNYENKSQEREFHSINPSCIKKNSIRNNIKWFILYNFTNIRDQTFNYMERKYNKEFTKIDIKHLNSETRSKNIQTNLLYFDQYEDIFVNCKDIIIKELNKLLNIKEDFLIDLVIFRTERGCFEVQKNKLNLEIRCLSSCFKVIKLNKDSYFEEILNGSKRNYKGVHLSYNPAFSWMLFLLYNKNILKEEQYNKFIHKFNEMAEKFEKKAKNIELKKHDEYDGKENTKNKKNKGIEYIDNFEKYDINKYLKKHKIKKNKSVEIKHRNIDNDKKDEKIINFKCVEKKEDTIEPKICDDLSPNFSLEKVETQEDNIGENTKKIKKSSHFCWCCGQDAVDVID